MTDTAQSWPEASVAGSAKAARTRAVGGRLAATAVLFAVYLFAHFTYLLNTNRVSWFSAVYLIAALGLLIAPRTPWLFALGAAAGLGDILTHLPMQSNHALMSGVFCAGVVYAWTRQAIISRSPQVDGEAFFAEFSPLGRWLLIGMYFYGVFHKLNTDFLNPEVSCAVVLWQAFGFPLGLGEWPLAHMAAMYGTLIVETVAILCLLSSRFRYYGLLLGIAFHWLIGFNPYQDYVAFSLIAILLHSFFFPPLEERLSAHRLASTALAQLRRPVPLTCVILLLIAAPLLLGRDAAWFLLGAGLILFVAIFARDTGHVVRLSDDLRPRSVLTGVLAAAFLANGMLPYLGLKTGQTISMFSNLTTEGGQSNHLVMAGVPQLFRISAEPGGGRAH